MSVLMGCATLLASHDARSTEPEPAAKKDKPTVGEPAPAFRLPLLNKAASGVSDFSLNRYVGQDATEKKKAMLLSFGASYCGPCKKELPALQALETKYKPRGLVTALVVIDDEPSGIEEMRKLVVDERRVAFPVLSDRFKVLANRYGADVLPKLVLIDELGQVRWHHTGYEANTMRLVENELTAILGVAPADDAAPQPNTPTRARKKTPRK